MNGIIKLEDRCKESELKSLKEYLLEGGLDNVNVELDFSSIESPDIRSIQLLLSWSDSVRSNGGSVKSRGVSENLNHYFEMTGTSSLTV